MARTHLLAKYRSLSDGATYAGCSERFLRRRIAEGVLESYLVSGRRFVTFAGIDKMMALHRNRRSRRGRGIRRIQDRNNTGGQQ